MISVKKVNTTPVDYVALNQLSQDFETQFVPQTELSAEQVFWSQNSGNSEEPNLSLSTTIVEVPKELPTISMAVEQHCVKKNRFQNKMKEILKENERPLEQEISTDIVNIVVNANVDHAYVAPLASKLRNNRTAHYDYLKHTQEETATLREIVENERLLNPLNTSLDYACKYTKRVQELLIILKQTCPCINDLGVNLLTSASGSQSQGNTKKDRIQQTQIRAKKNKIEDHPRNVVQIILWYLDFGCSKHMTGDRSQLINFVHKFLGTIKFKNDHVAKIMGYGDYKIVNVTISRVYFVEGLGHNLFSVGQFCDSKLEVAFCQHTCFIRNSDGVDLLTGSRGNNLYTLSLGDMMASSPICLLSKASKTKSWLWHHRLLYLNFEKVYLLHMDLCGPIRVESINEKKYILIIANDYSRFTWVKCLRSKEEATDFIIKFLKMIQVRIKVGISHETSVARSSQQNSVVERRNRTLIEATHTISYNQMLILESSLDMHQQRKHSGFTTGVRRIVETIHVDFDNLTAMASKQSSSGPALNEMTHDLLFQPLFDELLTPPPSVDPPAPEVIAPIADVIPLVQAESTGLPSSTTVDQDAPSPSKDCA
nr:hypothetical protein [Tanacetum cinerariifolium]